MEGSHVGLGYGEEPELRRLVLGVDRKSELLRVGLGLIHGSGGQSAFHFHVC